MTKKSHATGQQGERIAQAFLRRKGFKIEAVNWRLGRFGEIDVVAYHPQDRILAFTEVKTRQSNAFGLPEEAVDEKKQAQLLTLAEAFLCAHPLTDDRTIIRFDVISVQVSGPGQGARVSHIENAFVQG